MFDWYILKGKLNYYLIILISFFIPLSKAAIVPLFILLALSILFTSRGVKPIRNKKLLFIVGLYFLTALSLVYTNNSNATLFNLEVKFSLLIFPVLLYFSNVDLKNNLTPILKSFIEGCIAATVINFCLAAYSYSIESNISHFFYKELSSFSHVSYYSMYLCFAVAILYSFIFFPTKKNYIKPAINISLIILFSIALLFSVSKTGIITLVILHLSAIGYWIKKHNKAKYGIAIIISIFLSLGILYKTSSIVSNRIDGFSVGMLKSHKSPTTSTEMRIAAWEQAIILAKEKPVIGYGTGDVTDNLIKRYKIMNYKKLKEKGLNTHNQFLQTLLGSGVIGLLYIAFLIFFPLFKINSKSFILYLFFLTIIILNFMTESMLETQSGIVFFAFFITLFYGALPSKNELK